MTNNKFNRLLIEYADKFEDNFPIFCMMGSDEDEIIKIIQDCIENNEPYELKDKNTNISY